MFSENPNTFNQIASNIKLQYSLYQGKLFDYITRKKIKNHSDDENFTQNDNEKNKEELFKASNQLETNSNNSQDSTDESTCEMITIAKDPVTNFC